MSLHVYITEKHMCISNMKFEFSLDHLRNYTEFERNFTKTSVQKRNFTETLDPTPHNLKV